MEKEIFSRIKNKYDSQENWENNNPLLLKGEIILIDKGEEGLDFKVGDGVNSYNSLPFFQDQILKKVTLDFLTIELLESIYPIGTIYISTQAISPAQKLGFGSWEQIKDRFLLACGNAYAAGSIGGEATHLLTTSEMPSHYHTTHGIGIATTAYEKNLALRSVDLGEYHDGDTIMRTNSVGNNVAHNNMPPYLSVYVWKRIV